MHLENRARANGDEEIKRAEEKEGAHRVEMETA